MLDSCDKDGNRSIPAFPGPSMSDISDDYPIPEPAIGVCPKAYGVTCDNIYGQKRMTMFHPSRTNIQLTYCQEVLKGIKKLCFMEKIENRIRGWIHFRYKGPCPSRNAAALCPTPKLPRYKIDGVHPYSYKAFIAAINPGLQIENTKEIFIMRFVPVDPENEEIFEFEHLRSWNLAELKRHEFCIRKVQLGN